MSSHGSHPDSKASESSIFKLIGKLGESPADSAIKKASDHALSHEHKRPEASAGLKSHELPRAEDVFDSLLHKRAWLPNRRGASGDNSSGISSLVYSFACLADLSIRRPNNDISTYFDLYPLYGSDPSEADEIRLKDGSGMIFPDCFFDDRLFFLPRASAVLLILFNRHHNYIARRLQLHGEALQDDDIFEMARYINCAHFRKIVQEDILRPLVGLSTVGPGHKSDVLSQLPEVPPISASKPEFKSFVEAALLYDLSPIMSGNDISYVESTLHDMVNVKADTISPSEFDAKVYTATANLNKRRQNHAGLQRGRNGRFADNDLARILYESTETPAQSSGQGISPCWRVMQIKTIDWARSFKACTLNEYRNFLGLKPLANFEEWTSNSAVAEAAKKLYGSIDNLEVYPGLQGEDGADSGYQLGYTKTYALLFDIVSRIRRRDPASEEIFSHLSNAKAAKWYIEDCKLENPDNGSFGTSMPKLLQRTLPREYPYNNIYGLFPLSIPSNTIRCLRSLSDTSYFTSAHNKEMRLLPIQPDEEHLPDTEKKRKPILETEKPQARVIRHLVTRNQISHVCNKPDSFPTMYEDNLKALTNGYGYFLGFDDEKRHDKDQMMSLHALIPDSGALDRYATSFAKMTKEFIEGRTAKGSSQSEDEIDVARDVVNAVCTRWVCETLLDYPLSGIGASGPPKNNSSETPIRYPGMHIVQTRVPWLHHQVVKFVSALAKVSGRVSGSEVPDPTIAHAAFAQLYAFVFQVIDTENQWQHRTKAVVTGKKIYEHVKNKLPPPSRVVNQSHLESLTHLFKEVLGPYVLKIVTEFTFGIKVQGQTAQTFLERAVNVNQSYPPSIGRPTNDRVIANVIGLAVVAAVKYAKVCTQAIDFYLQEKYSNELNEIIKLSHKDDAKSKKLLMGYIRESFRLNHPLGVWRRVAVDEAKIPCKGNNGTPSEFAVQKGDLLYANFSKALTADDIADGDLDDPMKVNPRRRVNAIQGLGLHKCPGIVFVDKTMPEILGAIFRLKGIRRAPGSRGRLVQFTTHPEPQDTDPKSFLSPDGMLHPFPQSLVVQYDRDNQQRVEAISEKRARIWSITPEKNNKNRESKMNRVKSAILIFVLSLMALILLTIVGICTLRIVIWSSKILLTVTIMFSKWVVSAGASVPALPPRTPAPSGPRPACLPPLTPIQPWQIVTMKSGSDGKLIPLEYTLKHRTAHQLSLIDIDAKDLAVSFWVDNVSVGNSPSVPLNKTDNCGEDYGECLRRGFSAGVIVVPKGKHTVRVQWIGVEQPGPDGRIDWGPQGGRRVAWSRDSCAA
ncbi:hypothetical protein HYPSUDRAFT_38235 [Hypholoma sublateritium FD-334 SS-4]|uniref:Heme peroxidase n=1 Tax=Hypholoma sublateritium (strain FD-334 SS-4) TaxID=945553 RepID=A0A0D2LC93_HYPSF|nr:hypothetical protein HYPSUDRAFT_38235 [Hypholoma sublateritium FD-334 SS-4]